GGGIGQSSVRNGEAGRPSRLEAAGRVVRPAVTDGNRAVHLRAPHLDAVADDPRIGTDEAALRAGDVEADELAALGLEPTAHVPEVEDRLATLEPQRVDERTAAVYRTY